MSEVSEPAGRQVLISELRVFELKQELDKRSLDKNGIKLALVERLETALRGEGHDPLTFEFTISDYGKGSTPTRAASAKPTATDSKEEPIPAYNGDSAEKSEPKEESAEKNADKSGNTSTGDDHVLLIDDGDGEKAMIELDDEEGKNDVETEDFPEETEPEPEVDQEVDAEIEMEPETHMEAEENGETAPLEGAMEVESAMQEDEKESEDTTEPMEEQAENGKEKDEKVGKEPAEKEEEEVGTTPLDQVLQLLRESADNETKVKTEKNEESKKTPKAQTPKPATTIKKTSNSLWIKGLGSETKAADLKAMFAKCGRVVTAKIFTRRQQPSSTCFGYVTMVDTAAAEECIKVFNKTHINGHQVTVERADHSSMPTVKTGQKKSTGGGTTTATTSNSTPSKNKETTKNGGDKRKSEASSTGKAEKRDAKDDKTVSSSKPGGTKTKKPVEAPTKTGSEKVRSSREASSAKQRVSSPPVFRRGRRVDADRYDSHLHHTIRGGVGAHRASRISAMSRYGGGSGSYRGSFPLRGRGRAGRMMILPTRGHPIVSARGPFGERSRLMGVQSRHRSPPSSGGRMYDSGSSYRGDVGAGGRRGDPDWERREMMHMMRRREEEFRLKEEELKMQRERERMKFERERIERERLELEQLRQVTAMSASAMQQVTGTGGTVVQTAQRGYHPHDVDTMTRRRSGGRSGAERISSSSRHVSAYSGRDRRDTSRDDEIRAARSHAHRAADSDRERSRHGIREAYDYGVGSGGASRDFDRHAPRRPTAVPDAYARRVESSRAPPTYFSRGSTSSRMGGGGMDAGDMGGGAWAGSGAMTVPSAYAQSSSSREYVPQSGGGGGYGATNPASTYANTEWTAASSAYGGGGGSHSSHSAYGKPAYDKYDAYAPSKYSSRRY